MKRNSSRSKGTHSVQRFPNIVYKQLNDIDGTLEAAIYYSRVALIVFSI